MSGRRKLLTSEIDRIVNALDVVPLIIPLAELKEAALSTQKAILKAQLQNFEVLNATADAQLNELLEFVLKHYLSSQVVPGDTVGYRAAEALAQPATQIALNAFHFSGSNLNVTSGIGGIKEILEAKSTASQKHRMCTVHFKNKHLKLSDIIFHKQSQFVQSTMYDYVLAHDIIEARDFWDDPAALPDWLPIFQRTMTSWPVPGTDKIEWILELTMDADRMYAMNVTMEELANVIKSVDGNRMMFVWFSPMTVEKPVMYLAADKAKVKNSMGDKYGSLGDYLQLVNFNLEVIPLLKSYIFKGISGITGIHPVEQSVLGVITDEIRIQDNLWLIQLSRLQLRVTGITKAMLIELITHADTGMSIETTPESIDAEYILVVRTPTSETRKPTAILVDLRNEIEKAAKDLIIGGDPVASFVLLDRNQLYNLFNYYYLETEGTNLSGILVRKDIDTRYTISSDIHEITRTLGTEAVRNYVLFILYRMIKSNGMDIDPRHLMLIGDVMVSTGKLIGMTMTGAAKLVPDHLTKTTIGEATKHLMQAAVFGESDPLNSVTSALYLGKEPQLGTGMVKIKADKKLSDKLVAELAEGRTANLAIDDFTAALDQISNNQGKPLVTSHGRPLTAAKMSDMPVGTTGLPAPGTLMATPTANKFFDLSLAAGSVSSNLLRDAVKAVKLPDPQVCQLDRRRQRTIFPIKGLTSDIIRSSVSGIPNHGLNLLPANTIYDIEHFPKPLLAEMYEALDTNLIPTQPDSKYQKTIIGPPPMEPLAVMAETPVIATTGLDPFLYSLGTDVDLSQAWDI